MLERIASATVGRQRYIGEIPELAARAFNIETLMRGEQTLELISLESNYMDDERITPPNWGEQVNDAIERADIVFVEYFPPELEQTVPRIDALGSYSQDITATYGAIANLAHRHSTPVAVADIANRPLYELYRMGVYPVVGAAAVASAQRGGIVGKTGFIAGQAFIGSGIYQAALQRGVYGVEPSSLERPMLDATDARRVLTARGIDQTAKTLAPGSTILYIAAPAHVNRVKSMLTKSKTIPDSVKALIYKQLAGLDRATRIYTPTNDGWELAMRTQIR